MSMSNTRRISHTNRLTSARAMVTLSFHDRFSCSANISWFKSRWTRLDLNTAGAEDKLLPLTCNYYELIAGECLRKILVWLSQSLYLTLPSCTPRSSKILDLVPCDCSLQTCEKQEMKTKQINKQVRGRNEAR